MPTEKQKYQGIGHLLVGPTQVEVLENLLKKFQDREIDLLKFYEICKKHNIQVGPTEDEVA